MPTRRELFGGVSLLGGLGATMWPTSAAASATGDDVASVSDARLIRSLLSTELLVAYVYAHVLATGDLNASATRLVRELLGHERAHADALRAALADLHPPPAAGPPAAGPPAAGPTRIGATTTGPTTLVEAEALLAHHRTPIDLRRHRSADAWLRAMLDIEAVLERNYHGTIAQLSRTALVRLCAETLGVEAQHSALIGQLLYPRTPALAVPDTFVNGV